MLYAEGMSALRKQDLAGAQATFEKLIRIAPRSPEAHNSLGWVLLNQGQVDSAVEQFRAAIRLKPDFPQAHLNLANALSQRRDFAGAESEAREAVRLAPKDSETHRQLGRVLSFRGDSPNAISELQAAIALDLLQRARRARDALAGEGRLAPLARVAAQLEEGEHDAAFDLLRALERVLAESSD